MPTTYAMANQMLELLRSKPAVYLGLFTSTPGRDGSGGTEVSGGGYARMSVTFSAAAEGAMANDATIQSSQALTAWGTVSYFGLFDAAVGGSLLWFDAVTVAKDVVVGDFFIAMPGDLVLVEGECQCP